MGVNGRAFGLLGVPLTFDSEGNMYAQLHKV
jgi:hypothetical protein